MNEGETASAEPAPSPDQAAAPETPPAPEPAAAKAPEPAAADLIERLRDVAKGAAELSSQLEGAELSLSEQEQNQAMTRADQLVSRIEQLAKIVLP